MEKKYQNKEILQLFVNAKAILEGHFLLSSGLHSDMYVQCALVLQYPNLANKLAKLIVSKFNSKMKNAEVVVSPAVGGIIIGQEIARVLGCRAIFAERQQDKMTLRRGFNINKKEKCIIVEDVITTGGSTKEIIKIIKKHRAEIIGIASLVDRSSRKLIFHYPFLSLLKLNIKTYTSEKCLLCKTGLPVIKPGSRT